MHTPVQIDSPLDAASRAELESRYADLCSQGLKINMTRGVPSPEQLALAKRFLSLPGESDFVSRDGVDWRNYGGLQGMPEVRELFSEALLGLPADYVAVGENSSLALMYEALSHAFRRGVPGSDQPWSEEAVVKFICPVPGYDRHFSICDEFRIEMLPVPMLDSGPDMDIVEALVAGDPSIKGMWCVPKYSNPCGTTYTDVTVERLAAMAAAAPDFRLFWDNAYAVHHLSDEATPNQDITGRCAAAGHPNRAFVFASTSKIVLPGAGLAFFGSSPENLAWWLERRKHRTIGPDKVNQLRHLLFFGDADGLTQHMRAHSTLLAPKFACVDRAFAQAFGDTGSARWTRPAGGYFISLDITPGCAKRTVELAKQAGIALTPAGATHPGGRDPHDANIRISPSYVDLDTLAKASHGTALCAQLAAAEIR
ncbi:aminotransferase class I/II-fold pyridoxal phosphate-dependent enzyme [Paraherbaspirillum soli]|uniref:Aminotransferase class I/II-fold pyridoxal phosphate-dependent enzyme n=1 Tax=Paraherbaspirillum soli TaxID=631222 RepID=A0ABW0M8W6_9BURK